MTTGEHIEQFFGSTLPVHISSFCKNSFVFEKFNQKQIMEIIDFTPPFLKIEKMAVVGVDRENIFQNKGIATGVLNSEVAKGHYNDTLFLAMYGQLMASAASIYIAILFPSTAPQVIEVDCIKPSRDRVLWKPVINGSRFFVEICCVKKKLQLAVVDARLFSSKGFMGEVSRLKLVLTPKNSILEAKKLPECYERVCEKNSDILKETFKETGIEQTEEFFNRALPDYVKKNWVDKQIYKRLNQQDIMDAVDFTPPFLKIGKAVIFDVSKDSILQSTSLAMGTILPKDVMGHYNNTVFLAMCGLLMSSAASVHLAVLFPASAPEVIQAKGVRPIERKIWKPDDRGSTFWLETSIIKKKLHVVVMKTKISFDPMPYGMVDELKLFLIPRQLIWQAPQLQ